MKNYLLLSTFFFSICFANEDWQQHWDNGKIHASEANYEEASLEFDQAINLMSKEELEKHPYVLVDRAENDYILRYYTKVLQDTEMALLSINLSDYERLNCGMRRISVFMQLGDEESATEEYKKHLIGCPLFPKYEYFKEKIVIRNIPDCECYKKCAKELMLSSYCMHEDDIHQYGNTWIVSITRQNSCLGEEVTANFQKTPEQIQACCNTCNRFATAANFICGCLPVPPQLGGRATQSACKLACVMFVETLRQDCERCCRQECNKCCTCFESWKKKFKEDNPDCSHPLKNCPE